VVEQLAVEQLAVEQLAVEQLAVEQLAVEQLAVEQLRPLVDRPQVAVGPVAAHQLQLEEQPLPAVEVRRLTAVVVPWQPLRKNWVRGSTKSQPAIAVLPSSSKITSF
jgi:hypothetical protein